MSEQRESSAERDEFLSVIRKFDSAECIDDLLGLWNAAIKKRDAALAQCKRWEQAIDGAIADCKEMDFILDDVTAKEAVELCIEAISARDPRKAVE